MLVVTVMAIKIIVYSVKFDVVFVPSSKEIEGS